MHQSKHKNKLYVFYMYIKKPQGSGLNTMDGEKYTMIILIQRSRSGYIKFKEGRFQTEESCQGSRGAFHNDKRVNSLQFLSEDIIRGNPSQLIL